MGRTFLTLEEEKKLEESIRQAELNTSGEIRVHLDSKCKEDVLDHAAFVFEKLEMHKTNLRNGVLIYLATEDKKIAIIGDVGINAKIPQGFWNETKELMIAHLKKGENFVALQKAVEAVGNELKTHFSFRKGDENELSNKISY